jgi:predicted nucleic acid-binding protein
MATTRSQVVVSDAGPLIHLDELGCLDLLANLGQVSVPRAVWLEVTVHRPRLTLGDLTGTDIVETIPNPSERLISLGDSLDLDTGERAALALMEGMAANLFLCDDAAARLTAESLGFTVRGTIGILVRSIRVAARSQAEVLGILHQIPNKSSLHISRRLLESVISEVEKASPEP